MTTFECTRPGCEATAEGGMAAIEHVQAGIDTGELDHVMEAENTELGATITVSLTED